VIAAPRPPNPLDRAQCDFFLFPILKSALTEKCFRDIDKIKVNTAKELKTLTLKQFQRTFELWQDRWGHSISPGGEYFDGDIFK